MDYYSHYYYDDFESLISSLMGSSFSMIQNMVAIAFFVLGAIGTYQLAKARGCDKPWIGCIPFVNVWAIGWLCDDIRRVEGRKSSYRKILLGLSIGANAGIFLMVIFVIVMVVQISLNTIRWQDSYYDMEGPLAVMLVALLIFLIAYLAVLVCWKVFLLIACNQIFKAYAPANATLFTVLSVFFNLHYLFLFIIRNKLPVAPGGYPGYYAAYPNPYGPGPNGPVPPYGGNAPYPAQPYRPAPNGNRYYGVPVQGKANPVPPVQGGVPLYPQNPPPPYGAPGGSSLYGAAGYPQAAGQPAPPPSQVETPDGASGGADRSQPGHPGENDWDR